jgi:hypothetical protein
MSRNRGGGRLRSFAMIVADRIARNHSAVNTALASLWCRELARISRALLKSKFAR